MPRRLPRPELSLVIPIYNEEEVLPQLGDRLADLLAKLGADCEVVFVDDGSKDESLALLRGLAAKEPRFRVASFSRNFGHQRAITAGMDLARGKAVVVMDADLQDPPEVIVEMVAKWREGYDVVYGRRRSRAGESFFKLLTAKIFYRLFAAMIPIEVPLDTGDFRLMSRRVVQTLRGLRETHRFVRGLVAWVGFKQVAVEYDRAARAAGETKYPLRKMLAFAFDGIASFSIMPLRMASYAGLLVGLFGVAVMLFALGSFLWGRTVQGWTTTIMIMSFLFSVQLLLTGIVGEYVGKIYEEVKRRPLYLVKEKINFRPARTGPAVIAPQPIKTIIGGTAPSSEELDATNLQTDYGTPAIIAKLPPPMPSPELDSSNLKTDYGTTPAVMAKLPPPKPKASNPPPAPTPKKK
jgi:polyisoprenyl-phosphate glycosyltransferase